MQDDGDQHRAARKDSLKRIHVAHRLQNENIEEHDREPGKGKITTSRMHRHSVARVDADFDIRALAATKRDVPHQEWLCFLGMEFGMVEDERGILRWHPGARELKERDLTFVEVGKHYGLSDRTVQEYDRRVRVKYGIHLDNGRRAAG